MLSNTSEILAEMRRRSGLTQEEVAEKIGVSRTAYTRYENGTRTPEAIPAVKLARLFKIPVEWLLCLDEYDEQTIFEAEILNSIKRLNDAGKKQLEKQLQYMLNDPDLTKKREELAM